jgi:hypothetical protein
MPGVFHLETLPCNVARRVYNDIGLIGSSSRSGLEGERDIRNTSTNLCMFTSSKLHHFCSPSRCLLSEHSWEQKYNPGCIRLKE